MNAIKQHKTSTDIELLWALEEIKWVNGYLESNYFLAHNDIHLYFLSLYYSQG